MILVLYLIGYIKYNIPVLRRSVNPPRSDNEDFTFEAGEEYLIRNVDFDNVLR